MKFYINRFIIKMETNSELKEIDIKIVHAIISMMQLELKTLIYIFDFDNMLIDKKSQENILVYNILYKSVIDYKPLRYRFEKINEFIKVYDETRYLALLGSEKRMIRFMTALDIELV